MVPRLYFGLCCSPGTSITCHRTANHGFVAGFQHTVVNSIREMTKRWGGSKLFAYATPGLAAGDFPVDYQDWCNHLRVGRSCTGLP